MKNIFKLLIFLHLGMCFNAHAQVPGTPYILPGANTGGVIPGNTACAGATISVTGCANISGASINDNTGTTPGIEYDWTGGPTYTTAPSSTRALVEINGQCWYLYDSDVIPVKVGTPTWTNNIENGWNGWYTGCPCGTEGRLYQWLAAMDSSTQERARGVCAPGFHVPSRCEYDYLQYYLESPNGNPILYGSTAETRFESNWLPNLGGLRVPSGSYVVRGSTAQYITSTIDPFYNAPWDILNANNAAPPTQWSNVLGQFQVASAEALRCIAD